MSAGAGITARGGSPPRRTSEINNATYMAGIRETLIWTHFRVFKSSYGYLSPLIDLIRKPSQPQSRPRKAGHRV